MGQLFNTFLYQPILNLLILIYDFFPIKDMGITIILLTILIRIILWPLSKKTITAQQKMKELQPKIAEITKKYKDLQERNTQIMRLYKENHANPASSCLPLVIQLPILLAVFQVFKDGFDPAKLQNLYSFVPNPGVVDKLFLNISFFDLSEPNFILALITAVIQYWQNKMLVTIQPPISKDGAKDESIQAALNKQMLYMMPIMTLLIGIGIPGLFKGLPSGLMLYWLVSTLLMGLQQKLYMKTKMPLVIENK